MLSYCSDLDERDWEAESCASGWRVKDVVAHLGASCRVLASPKALGVLRSKDSEAYNEILVDERRTWPAARVLAEFERWSKVTIVVMGLASRRPGGTARVPLGNLGSYPIWMLPSTLVFDWHTHLHHDIVPVIGKPAPAITSGQLVATVEWMLAGLEQMNRRDMGWVDRPLRLELTGDGGGCWDVAPAGDGLLTVSAVHLEERAAHIAGTARDFPLWATTRMPWREAGLTINGDRVYAARFLDTVNII